MKKILLALLALAVIIPGEVYLWTHWISPFFWSPGVAYTQLAWGYVFFGMLFIFLPCATVAGIFELDEDKPPEDEARD